MRAMEDVLEILSEYSEVQGEDREAFLIALETNIDSQKKILSYLSKKNFPVDSRVFELLFYAYRGLSSPLFVAQYIPSLLYLYLGCSPEERRSISKLETLLLTLYNSNLELLSEGFRLPALNQSSIFHDASRIEINELRAWKVTTSPSNNTSAPLVMTRINAQSRQVLLASLLRVFNHHLGAYPKFILKSFLDSSISLLQKGYSPKKTQNRIRISAQGLLELLTGGYFCFYNDLQRQGSQLVDIVHARGVLDAHPGVLSAARATKSLLTTQGTTSVTVGTPTFSQIAKNMITNASFRTKKMGDDIPVVDVASSTDGAEGAPPNPNITVVTTNGGGGGTGNGNGPPNSANNALASISEENNGLQAKGPEGEEGVSGGKISQQIQSCADLKEKLIAKLPLKKKNKSLEYNNNGSGDGSKVAFSGGSGSSVVVVSSSTSGSSTPPTSIVSLSQPLTISSGEKSSSEKNKLELLLRNQKKGHFSNNGELIEIDSLEQVEELIKKKNLPPETIAILDPESGTTVF